MKTMTIIAYKNIPPHSTNESFDWDGFQRQIADALKQEKGIETPLGNVWQLTLAAGLRLLPVFQKEAQNRRVRIAVLVSEDSTLAVL